MMNTSAAYGHFEQRKQEHITHALDPNSQAQGGSGLDRIQLIHEALPELDFQDINLQTTRFGQPVETPFLVSSMTAGHHDAKNINLILAEACCEMAWAMGVGSQRRELSDPEAHQEWQSLATLSDKLTLFGNLGIAQLIQTPVDQIRRLVDNLNANAMIIHTNPLQECLQKEGTPQFKGGLNALEQLCAQLDCPVILKETGCGFSTATINRLKNTGLAALDLSGYGGTHWGRIEGMRNPTQSMKQQAAETFRTWGIATLTSLVNAKQVEADFEIWGSGGLRSGLDAAKLLALGASTVGFAKPMLAAALEGTDAVIKLMQTYHYELKVALFCTGCNNLLALQEKHRDLIC